MADQDYDGNGDFQGDMGGDYNQEAEDALLNGAENGNGDQVQQSESSGRDDDRYRKFSLTLLLSACLCVLLEIRSDFLQFGATILP